MLIIGVVAGAIYADGFELKGIIGVFVGAIYADGFELKGIIGVVAGAIYADGFELKGIIGVVVSAIYADGLNLNKRKKRHNKRMQRDLRKRASAARSAPGARRYAYA